MNVIPHWVHVNKTKSLGSITQAYQFNNSTVKVGYVVAIHYPKDPGFESISEPIFDVLVRESFLGTPIIWNLYKRVRLAFPVSAGTGQDRGFTQLRVPSKWQENKKIELSDLEEASKVVMVCEQGFSRYGIILGMLNNSREITETKKDDLGYHYKSQFNGMVTTINKDGEYSIARTGKILDATKNIFIEQDAAVQGAFLKFTKEGGIALDNNHGESTLLDNQNKKITIKARGMETTVAETDYNVTTSSGKIGFLANGNAIFNSSSKVYIGAEDSSDPLVLGFKLAEALEELVKIVFFPGTIVGRVGAAIPVFTDPVLIEKMWTWKTKWTTRSPGSGFLSKKGFVE